MPAPSPRTLYLGPSIESGIAQWNTMALDLEQAWPEVSAELKALNAAAPWGNGAEGRMFAQAYLKDDGPSRLVESGTALVGEIVDVGPLLRETIANSRSTDTAIAEDLASGGRIRREV
ncbi:hypothetical protein AB0L53_06805 [Nonomuraea sp. NPDC052129]|uniref:hypothetical protein n=1 Tax=Nonomuraea sp. NPDC052129 TaxID=3154651 RepID=UPI00343E2F0A